MNKKIIAGIVIALILCVSVIVFFVVRPKKDNDKKEVVFWTLQMNEFTPYMTDVIAKFENEHPDINIKWIDVPFSEGEKRTLAAILSNNPPSLVNLNPDFSSVLAQKGALEEIPLENLNDFNKPLLKSLEVNGKLYAVPWYATSAVTIYNKSLLAKAGFSMPPLRYEDYKIYAEAVKNKTGKYLFMPTITENDTMLKILNKYGINSSSALKNKDSVELFNNIAFFFIFLFGLSNAMEFGSQYTLALTFVALITDC